MRVAVIGSGPSAISALEELAKKNIIVDIYDIGKILPSSIKKLKEKLKNKAKNQWDKTDYNKITLNKTINESIIPKKAIFGSFYPYNNDNSIKKLDKLNIEASCAKGGFLNVWGAAMLPTNDIDMEGWPIEFKTLEKHYKQVLETVPYSLINDDLSNLFPTFKTKNSNILIPDQSTKFLDSLKKIKKNNVFFGQSRLAIKNNVEENCRYCGSCLSGCVFDIIYNGYENLEKIINNKKIKYFSGIEIISYLKDNNKVRLLYKENNKEKKTRPYDKVFIAAGPLNTAKIVMNSNNKINKVYFLDSQKFLIPILNNNNLKEKINNINSLASIFFEYIQDKKNIVHMQISNNNLLINQKIPKYLKWSLFKITNYLMIGWAGIHSNYSDKILMEENGKRKFKISIIKNKNKKKYIIKFSLIFFLKMLSIKKVSLPFPLISKVGGGNHIGGSFPMKKKPKLINETDITGQLLDKNVHIIDSSVLPTIPATTIAFLTMANAKRIINKIFK